MNLYVILWITSLWISFSETKCLLSNGSYTTDDLTERATTEEVPTTFGTQKTLSSTPPTRQNIRKSLQIKDIDRHHDGNNDTILKDLLTVHQTTEETGVVKISPQESHQRYRISFKPKRIYYMTPAEGNIPAEIIGRDPISDEENVTAGSRKVERTVGQNLNISAENLQTDINYPVKGIDIKSIVVAESTKTDISNADADISNQAESLQTDTNYPIKGMDKESITAAESTKTDISNLDLDISHPAESITAAESTKTDISNPAESQQVSMVASHRLLALPAGNSHGHDKSFSKSSSHKSSQHKDGGEKGEKGFHSDKGEKHSHEEKHGKKGASGHFHKGGKHHKGHHHKDHHHGHHKSGKKASKGHKHGKKGHHHKGHHKKGFKNTYSKTESGKSNKFYTDKDFKKYGGDHDHFHKFFHSDKGGEHKGGKHSGGKHHDKHGKKGFFKNAGHHDKHAGHKEKHSHEGHSSHKSGHSEKGGHKSAKGSSHKSGGKH